MVGATTARSCGGPVAGAARGGWARSRPGWARAGLGGRGYAGGARRRGRLVVAGRRGGGRDGAVVMGAGGGGSGCWPILLGGHGSNALFRGRALAAGGDADGVQRSSPSSVFLSSQRWCLKPVAFIRVPISSPVSRLRQHRGLGGWPGESHARRRPMRNTTTPAGAIFPLGGVFMAIIVPSLLSDVGGNPWSGPDQAAAAPRCRYLL
jgi:hypothetical protein